jgi:two-component system NtrC family sensor kinase
MSETESKKQADSFQECSRRILDLAYSGPAQQRFLPETLTYLARYAGVQSVRLVIRDQTRRIFTEVLLSEKGDPLRSYSLREIDLGGSVHWSEGVSDEFETLCRKVFNSQGNPELPWFSASGSLRIDDVSSFPGLKSNPGSSNSERGLTLSPSGRSTLVIPVDSTRRRLGLIQLESDTLEFFNAARVDHFERLVQTIGIACDLRTLQVALRERVRELTCLYDIARLAAKHDAPLEEIMQEAVQIIPTGWLYPEATAARIVLHNRTYQTIGADRLLHSMKTDIVVDGIIQGNVEVGYVDQRPAADEGPFLTEERHLLDTIARELAITVGQRSNTEERDRLQVQLRHADRLATIGQLAAGVAHELNEPLSSIMGFGQLAAKQPNVPPEVVRDLSKIVDAAMHARGIIRELLVFARETKPIKVALNLNDLIKDGLFFLESRFVKAGITLKCELDPDLPNITADRSQFLQVLTNLVVNSVQAMPDGGRLIIRTEHGDAQVRLVVEDTGNGIDEDVMKNIFHPFFTTKDIDQGTGLGLSVVHGIVTSHDGRIDVNSAPGEGTRFIITLPVSHVESTEGQTRAG